MLQLIYTAICLTSGSETDIIFFQGILVKGVVYRSGSFKGVPGIKVKMPGKLTV